MLIFSLLTPEDEGRLFVIIVPGVNGKVDFVVFGLVVTKNSVTYSSLLFYSPPFVYTTRDTNEDE